MNDLTKDDFVRILTEPRNAQTAQQLALMSTEGLTVRFTDDAVEEIATIAFQVNRTAQNIGARRLQTIMEKVMEDLSFDAPERSGDKVTIDAQYVRQRLAEIVEDVDTLVLRDSAGR